ncbi:R3H domain containing-like [Sardina pilchardus]|uniref:R3H domain containing-like n=1 Tax=Sardina pilchardus TaxID=27697 RepID=UPI002E12203F
MPAPLTRLLFAAIWWASACTCTSASALPTNSTFLLSLPEAAVFGLGADSERKGTPQAGPGVENGTCADRGGVVAAEGSDVIVARVRRRRAISSRDLAALLDYHNRVRSQVSPPAANMEIMVWDDRLARSAESWASRCIWDHGPSHVMKHTGQNLSINSGRYRSVIDLVRSWHDERHAFSYPTGCNGAVCSHYTQMVWANTNRMGCAIHKCYNMYVFGSTWKKADFLVCNYSIKGNWVGEAPYKRGKPCSACPSSYGGSCSRNQCSGRSSRRVQSSRSATSSRSSYSRIKKFKRWY